MSMPSEAPPAGGDFSDSDSSDNEDYMSMLQKNQRTGGDNDSDSEDEFNYGMGGTTRTTGGTSTFGATTNTFGGTTNLGATSNSMMGTTRSQMVENEMYDEAISVDGSDDGDGDIGFTQGQQTLAASQRIDTPPKTPERSQHSYGSTDEDEKEEDEEDDDNEEDHNGRTGMQGQFGRSGGLAATMPTEAPPAQFDHGAAAGLAGGPKESPQQPQDQWSDDSTDEAEEDDEEDEEEEEEEDEEDEEDADHGNGNEGYSAMHTVGASGGWQAGYNPDDYKDLDVAHEIKELFQYITRYKPQTVEIETKLRPFIPDYIPAVGDIDAFIKIPRPDGEADALGLTVLDEPAAIQSDPAVLQLRLRQISKDTVEAPVSVPTIERADKSGHLIDKWAKDISKLHRVTPQATVHYTKNMPSIDDLMQIWPPEFEELLKSGVELPSADMDVDLDTYARIVCGIMDVPVHSKMIESLHLLFSVYSDLKANQLFKQQQDEEQAVAAVEAQEMLNSQHGDEGQYNF